MTSSTLIRSVATVALTLAMALPATAQSVVGKGKSGPAPDPVNLDITGLFQAKFASVGDDLFIAGQPTEKALRDLKARGGNSASPTCISRCAGRPSIPTAPRSSTGA